MNAQSLCDRSAIVGVGETPYVRRSERPFKELQLEAINKTIADAGMAPSEIDGIITDQLITLALMPVGDVLASLKMPGVGFITYTPPVGPGITVAPLVATPLRVPDCCLVTDGVGAYVVSSAERAKDCPHPPVYVMGVGYAALPIAGDSFYSQNPDYVGIKAAGPAAARALEMAGVTLKDVDFAEIYDCFTISVLMQMEDIGFCAKGEGARFVQGGRIELEGALPVNTHGGLLSQGYVLGINHIVEAVRQLRHEAGPRQVQGAAIGLVSASPDREHATLILRR